MLVCRGLANIVPSSAPGAFEAGPCGGLSAGGVNRGERWEVAARGCGGAGACSLADNLSLLLTVESRAQLPSKRVKPVESCESWLTSAECKAPLMEPSALVKTSGLDLSAAAAECAACSQERHGGMGQHLRPTAELLGWCQPWCLSLPWESLAEGDINGYPHPVWLLNQDPKSTFAPYELGK